MSLIKLKVTITSIIDVDSDDYIDVIEGDCTPEAIADHVYYQILGGPEVVDTIFENDFTALVEVPEIGDIEAYDDMLTRQQHDREERFGSDEDY